ncbi:MAG: STN domain-containing protein [Armatimonadota bacterium]|nr:STN domain-containing protein [Armatimonadota bacterium]
MQGTHWVRYFLVVFVLALAAVSVLSDEQPRVPGSDKIVNLELKDVSIEEAIDAIFRGSNVPYAVRPGISGRVKELKLRGLTVDDAIKALADAAKAVVRVENGVYVIEPKPAASESETRVVVGKRTQTSEAQPQSEQQAPPAEQPQTTEQPSSAEQQAQAEAPQAPSAEQWSGAVPPGYYPGVPTPYPEPYGFYPYYFPYRPMYQLGSLQILGGRPPLIISEPGIPPSAFRSRLGGPQRPVVPYGPVGGWLVPEGPIVPYPVYPW